MSAEATMKEMQIAAEQCSEVFEKQGEAVLTNGRGRSSIFSQIWLNLYSEHFPSPPQGYF